MDQDKTLEYWKNRAILAEKELLAIQTIAKISNGNNIQDGMVTFEVYSDGYHPHPHNMSIAIADDNTGHRLCGPYLNGMTILCKFDVKYSELLRESKAYLQRNKSHT